MTNRRKFLLGSILTLGAAPAIVRAESIMRIRPTMANRLGQFGYIETDFWFKAVNLNEQWLQQSAIGWSLRNLERAWLIDPSIIAQTAYRTPIPTRRIRQWQSPYPLAK